MPRRQTTKESVALTIKVARLKKTWTGAGGRCGFHRHCTTAAAPLIIITSERFNWAIAARSRTKFSEMVLVIPGKRTLHVDASRVMRK